MKKKFLLILTCIVGLFIGEQSETQASKLNIGLSTGMGFTKPSISNKNRLEDASFRPGFIFGPEAEILLDAFSINSGILFNYQRRVFEIDNVSFVNRTIAFDVPVYFAYNFGFDEDINLFLEAGTIGSLYVSGTYEDYTSDDRRRNIKFGNGKDGNNFTNYKPISLSVGLGTGIRFGRIKTSFNYEFGVTTLSQIKDFSGGEYRDYKLKNSLIKVRISYFLFQK